MEKDKILTTGCIAKPLLESIEESMNLMRHYIARVPDCKIVSDGMSIGDEISGPPNYDIVLQCYEATSDSKNCYFRHLGSLVPHHFSKEDLVRLFDQYERLRNECEDFRDYERMAEDGKR